MHFISFSATTRTVLLASGLALAMAFAAPTQAADNTQFGFSFGTGGSGFSFSLGNGGYIGRHFAPPPPPPVCMNWDQMRAQLRGQGFRWISFEGGTRGWVHVSARRYGQPFAFDMNRCTGSLANMQAQNYWGNTGPGFPGAGGPGPGNPGPGNPGPGFGGPGYGGFGATPPGPGFHR